MSSHKRKRAPSSGPSSSTVLPSDVINPLSHPPNTLKQFPPAGLSSDLPLPSQDHPSFPHRPIPQRSRNRNRRASSASAADGDDEATEADAPPNPTNDSSDDGDDGDDTDHSHASNRSQRRSGTPSRLTAAYRARLGALTAAVQHFLSDGDIPSASRAFGLVARARVYGVPVDLRRERLWEYGAEILMREADAEVAAYRGEDGEEGGRERVATFYQWLVRQYPWLSTHLSSVSALDFYPALFGCQMEGVHAAQVKEVERAEEDLESGRFDWGEGGYEEDEDEDEDAMDVDGGGGGSGGEGDYQERSDARYERKLRRAKDRIRQTALARMRELEKKMDDAMAVPPFSTHPGLLRLRGMVALYVADLCVPLDTRSDAEEIEGARAREAARNKAKKVFRTFKEKGGEVEEQWILEMLEEDEEDDDDDEEGSVGLPTYSSMPMYSSLPMR